jgi:hypothetical protein
MAREYQHRHKDILEREEYHANEINRLEFHEVDHTNADKKEKINLHKALARNSQILELTARVAVA